MRSRINWYLVAAGVILVAAAFMFFSGPARSQALCGPAPFVLRSLLDTYGEAVLMTATMPGGEIVVTRSFDGSWSVLKVSKGVACIVMGGKVSAMDKGV